MQLKDMRAGDCTSIVCYVKDVQEGRTKYNKPFLTFTLLDSEKTEIKARKWDMTKEAFTDLGAKLIFCKLSVSIYKEELSYEVGVFREATEEEGNVVDFIQSAPMSGETMFQEIYDFAKTFHDKDYGTLVCNIYMDHKKDLLVWGAAKAVHHNMIGGLLYHTYRMLQSATAIAKIYQFRKEVLYTGVILHDIGKLVELSTNEEGVSEYTVAGSLLTHSLLGCDLVKEYGEKLDLPKEKIMVLRHLIAAHHGRLEWGAIEKPKITEAFLLHQLDVIDAGMFQLESLATSPGAFSDKVFGLDNQKFYEPRF